MVPVRNFCGHGVGRHLHTSPTILHHRNNSLIGPMMPGHIFTIEPMINEGSAEVEVRLTNRAKEHARAPDRL